MLQRQCPPRIHHQLVLSLHRATSPCIPENFPFKSANNPFAERWRTADRKRPLPIPLRGFFLAEWYSSPHSAHKSAFLLYHFLVLTPPCLRGRASPVFRAPPFFHLLSLWEKVGPVNLREKLQKTKRKIIYRNPCLVFRPRRGVRALPPW
jgi:hypothetical protein